MQYTVFENDLPDHITFTDSVAIDTETLGLNIHHHRLCLVQLADSKGNIYMVKYNAGSTYQSPNLVRLLLNESILKIVHFARFDITKLEYTFGIKVNNYYCTKLASKVVRTFTDKHSLKHLVKEFIGIDIPKQEQLSDWGAHELTNEQLIYAATDVIYLHRIQQALDALLIREGKVNLYHSVLKGLSTVCDLDKNGYSLTLYEH